MSPSCSASDVLTAGHPVAAALSHVSQHQSLHDHLTPHPFVPPPLTVTKTSSASYLLHPIPSHSSLLPVFCQHQAQALAYHSSSRPESCRVAGPAGHTVTAVLGSHCCLCCGRHSEILSQGALPYFVDFQNCPEGTMWWWPKDLLQVAPVCSCRHETCHGPCGAELLSKLRDEPLEPSGLA